MSVVKNAPLFSLLSVFTVLVNLKGFMVWLVTFSSVNVVDSRLSWRYATGTFTPRVAVMWSSLSFSALMALLIVGMPTIIVTHKANSDRSGMAKAIQLA